LPCLVCTDAASTAASAADAALPKHVATARELYRQDIPSDYDGQKHLAKFTALGLGVMGASLAFACWNGAKLWSYECLGTILATFSFA
jgi:hypothetical protein